MKKTLLAAICCMTIGFGSTAMAQNEMPARTGRGGMRTGMEMVADTAIINHLSDTISAEQLKQIEAINSNYRVKMQEMLSQRSTDGRRMTREDREARMEQIKQNKAAARKELREVLGDELYIEYLEAQLDRIQAMGMGMSPRSGQGGQGMGPRGGGQGMGGGRPRGGQRGGYGGGFGGGDDFGGGDF